MQDDRPAADLVVDTSRMGVHELRAKKTPVKVVLNEAVELAKKFSSEEAAPFVNGVLDAVLKSFKEKEKS